MNQFITFFKIQLAGVFFMLLISGLNAQPSNIAEVEIEIATETNDSVRLHWIKKLVISLRNSDPKKHIIYINQGILLAEKESDLRSKAILIREHGIYFKKQNELDSAMNKYNLAIKLFAQIPDSVLIYDTYSSIGILKKSQGKYAEALSYLYDVIQFMDGDSLLFTQQKLLMTKYTVATIYALKYEHEKCIQVLIEILNNPLISSNQTFKRGCFVTVSGQFSEIQELDSALFYATKANQIKGTKRSQANLLNNLGIIYEKRGELGKAHQNYQEALGLYTQLKDVSGEIKSYNNLGNVLLKQKKFQNAEYYLLKAEEGLKKHPSGLSLKANYELLATLYINSKKFEKAIKYLALKTILKDSLLGLDKQKAIAEIETKYEVEKNELIAQNAINENKLLLIQSDKDRVFYTYLIVFIALILLVLVLYFVYYQSKKKQQQIAFELVQTKKELDLEQQSRGSELTALRSQMNPHFVFNALNSIQEYIITNKKELAGDYLGLFADLMRKYLHFSSQENISLEDEIDTLEMYLKLEKVRFEETLVYSIKVDDEIDVSETKIPVMLIQPFAENAFKHGLLHKRGKRELIISFTKENEILAIRITDNGVGRKQSAEINKMRHKSHKSFATSAQNKRIELINKGDEYQIIINYIDLQNEKGNAIGTQVEILISA